MAAPNGVQPTVCRVIFIYNFGPISSLFYIYHIENLFLFKLWCHEVFNQSCFEFADCKLERGVG